MKNRNLNHKDDWATPPEFYEKLNKRFHFDFDPCPYCHDLTKWDGLKMQWGRMNYINPPYSRLLKEEFIKRAYRESIIGNKCVMLLPVSTSTKIFHHYIYNEAKIEFVEGRVPFIGINSKDEYVNWHLWDRKAPEGVVHVKNSGQHDSMIVIFDGRK
ncbi:MAG: DNA N-6-adenine-methyltransferase (Dam) [Ignavibacteria bacterium ADurb.Bin266]|nr:MAG: DNA N-6-adenine-methyltransferase (Dam) [Ignavibacteria bacterium ADurb.Bin266]